MGVESFLINVAEEHSLSFSDLKKEADKITINADLIYFHHTKNFEKFL